MSMKMVFSTKKHVVLPTIPPSSQPLLPPPPPRPPAQVLHIGFGMIERLKDVEGCKTCGK